MKALAQAVVIAAALALPAVSFAQSDSHLTRAQVRAELVQLEKAGYHPGDGDNTQYPQNILDAEAKVAAQRATSSSYGGTTAGSSASGSPASAGAGQ